MISLKIKPEVAANRCIIKHDILLALRAHFSAAWNLVPIGLTPFIKSMFPSGNGGWYYHYKHRLALAGLISLSYFCFNKGLPNHFFVRGVCHKRKGNPKTNN